MKFFSFIFNSNSPKRLTVKFLCEILFVILIPASFSTGFLWIGVSFGGMCTLGTRESLKSSVHRPVKIMRLKWTLKQEDGSSG